MIQFENQFLFYFFIPIIIICFWYYLKGKRISKDYANVAIGDINSFLLTRIDFERVHFKSFFFITASILLFITSLGPQIGTELKKINKQATDIYILIDTSTSMDASDISPSRIKKSIIELNRFINSLRGDRVGIIVFAGSAHIHCPLTTDYAAVKLFLNSINTNMIMDQGTNIASAIDLAINNIYDEEDNYKTILLVSDGEEHEVNVQNVISDVKEKGINIYSLGVGSIRGGPIPVYDDNGARIDFKKDKNGNIVTSTLNEKFLYTIAKETGGIFIRIDNKLNSIMPIINSINNLDKRTIEHHVYSGYQNRFRIFLILSFLFFIIEFIIPTNNRKKYFWKGKFRK
tara:strand:+ start:619 stop:1653 length:1035 start_codon:yes stop_codon:yes gene_type:complete